MGRQPGRAYHERVARNATLFDDFMNDVVTLWNEFWVIALVAVAVVIVVVAATVVARSRERAKYRQPQYRRHSYMD